MAKHNKSKIETTVGKLLQLDLLDREKFRRKLEEAVGRLGDDVYSALIYRAVHLEFTGRAAKKHFNEAFSHWEELCARTGRDVDFRVALLDYYLAINKRIKNPKIIEIKVFEKTQQQSEIDELTRLHNYRYFIKSIEHEVSRSRRYRSDLSMVLFDVDDFKHYNDTNGHLAGNRALRKLAGIIAKAVREVDIVARFGGEEFALLLPETNRQGACTIAERIRANVEAASFAKGGKQPLKRFTVSGGVATFDFDAPDSATLINESDKALYRAKAQGKNRIA